MKENEIVLPNYNNSILNLITSILKNYHVESEHSTLPQLDSFLQKEYQNIVLIVLDGLGNSLLHQHSPSGFFAKNQVNTITSVFPSTTAAALTTYYSGKPPIESGWIAWSQYFKEYGRAIDMLPCIDSYTGEKIKTNRFNFDNLVGYTPIYQKIKKASHDIQTYEIKPSHCEAKNSICINANTIKDLCDSIYSLCTNSEKKFVFAYNDNPDTILHRNGCSSSIIKEFLSSTELAFQELYCRLKGTNTLCIISADHGHNDIQTTYNILDFTELQNCFIMPPSLESRCISFWIKPDKKDLFVKTFHNLFQDAYTLYTKEEFLDKHFLGYGKQHQKVDDFIGDYIAIAISDTVVKLETDISRQKPDKLSTHCGLTKNEMEVPLILLDLK